MAQGLYHYLGEAWKKPNSQVLRERMTQWRSENAVVKVERPLRLDKARMLGYKAKKGFIIARVRLIRGGRKREKVNARRRTKRKTVRKTLKMSYRWIAEMRAARKFTNLEVLNSYWTGKDGMYYFFEVILVDPERPEIQSDSTIKWICQPENRGRVFRGLTSAGKKSRGLRSKSRNLKIRPSLRAWSRKGK